MIEAAVDQTPIQRAFGASAATLQDDFIAALDRAAVARRVYRAADSGSDAREIARKELEAAVGQLRSLHGEINDLVAA